MGGMEKYRYAALLMCLLLATTVCNSLIIKKTPVAYRPSRMTLHSLTGDKDGITPNGQGESDEETVVDYDALFQARLAQEGGVVGVTAKTNARKAAKTMANSVDGVKQEASKLAASLRPQVKNAKSKGLLSNGDWDFTLIALGSVVLLAFFLPLFTGGGFQGDMAMTPDRFDSNGNGLEFGVR